MKKLFILFFLATLSFLSYAQEQKNIILNIDENLQGSLQVSWWLSDANKTPQYLNIKFTFKLNEGRSSKDGKLLIGKVSVSGLQTEKTNLELKPDNKLITKFEVEKGKSTEKFTISFTDAAYEERHALKSSKKAITINPLELAHKAVQDIAVDPCRDVNAKYKNFIKNFQQLILETSASIKSKEDILKTNAESAIKAGELKKVSDAVKSKIQDFQLLINKITDAGGKNLPSDCNSYQAKFKELTDSISGQINGMNSFTYSTERKVNELKFGEKNKKFLETLEAHRAILIADIALIKPNIAPTDALFNTLTQLLNSINTAVNKDKFVGQYKVLRKKLDAIIANIQTLEENHNKKLAKAKSDLDNTEYAAFKNQGELEFLSELDKNFRTDLKNIKTNNILACENILRSLKVTLKIPDPIPNWVYLTIIGVFLLLAFIAVVIKIKLSDHKKSLKNQQILKELSGDAFGVEGGDN